MIPPIDYLHFQVSTGWDRVEEALSGSNHLAWQTASFVASEEEMR